MIGEPLQDGLALVVRLVTPIAVAAAGAGLGVGWLAHRLGVADPAPVLVARTVAVVAVVAWLGPSALAELADWTRALWSGLPAIGRGAT